MEFEVFLARAFWGGIELLRDERFPYLGTTKEGSDSLQSLYDELSKSVVGLTKEQALQTTVAILNELSRNLSIAEGNSRRDHNED